MSNAPKMKFCLNCGGSGIDLEGNPCPVCKQLVKSAYESVSCMMVPEQYRGVVFNIGLLPPDIDISYGQFLQSLYESIIAGQLPKKNYLIASAVGHGKTVFAYSCLEQMFRRGYPVVPVYDVLELINIISNFDMGKKQTYDIDQPELITEAPLLFVKIPRVSRYDIFDATSMILDRRVRRGNITIFLYDGNFQYLSSIDRFGILTGLQGNGLYSTFEVKSWTSSPNIHYNAEENLG